VDGGTIAGNVGAALVLLALGLLPYRGVGKRFVLGMITSWRGPYVPFGIAWAGGGGLFFALAMALPGTGLWQVAQWALLAAGIACLGVFLLSTVWLPRAWLPRWFLEAKDAYDKR
jgi:hypothetical protein